jgi:hypothetical protein
LASPFPARFISTQINKVLKKAKKDTEKKMLLDEDFN